MIAAFAQETNLTTIVGTATPGRLLSDSVLNVGNGYILGLPVAAYPTWQGVLLGAKGVSTHIQVELPSEALRPAHVVQLERATETAKTL